MENKMPMSMDPSMPPMEKTMGGRRRCGTKGHHGGKRRGNASLRAWVTFVKKVQKEEGIGYKEAMSVAKKRKDKGEKWRGGDADMNEKDDASIPVPDDMSYGGEDADAGEGSMMPTMEGGRRRRRMRTRRRARSHKRSRSSRRSRSHRRSRRHH